MQKPSIGRVVHYVNDKGEHQPAIIGAVHSDTCVSLTVFPPFEDCYKASSRLYQEGKDPDGKLDHQNNSWHWPERVDE